MMSLTKHCNKITARLILLAILTSLTILPVANAEVTVEAANATVEDYMDTLFKGKTYALKNKLGKSQLRRNKKTIESKEYGKYLKKLYKQARYEIINTEIIDPQAAIVDVKLTYKTDDTARFRFWLSETIVDNVARLEIVRETDIID